MTKSINNETKNILFVCSGNVCRSVMAEALLKDKIVDYNIQIKSAGISAYHGASILPNAHTILKEKGIEYSHKSQPITRELILWSDLILTMTRSQKLLFLAKLPTIADRVFTLKEYVGLTDQIVQISMSLKKIWTVIVNACKKSIALSIF